MAICMNCNLLLRFPHQTHEYYAIELNPDLVAIVEEWCGREISDVDRLCQECITLILREATNRNEFSNNPSARQYGHTDVCVSCGLSIDRQSGRRRSRLVLGSVERNYIEQHIFPRQVPDEAWACFSCWVRAHNNAVIYIEPPEHNMISLIQGENISSEAEVTSAIQESIPSSETLSWIVPSQPPESGVVLQNYSRTSDNTSRCFVPDCHNLERLRVPKYMRRTILKQYRVFITANARVCQNHIMTYNWDLLQEHEFGSIFTSEQIEEMLKLLSSSPASCVLNFENVQNTNDSLCHYWTGLTIANFLALYNNVPQLNELFKKGKTALGLYLVKLRTGESMARMATLFLVSKGTVSAYTKKVRDILMQFYVPVHLGLNHITREEHSARNLLIPQGLFGTQNNNPIVICDGTYIYIQKSSNYFYQKKTWSLHKYQNLVKPFLLVACDGHIIDAIGPYAATQSDADIMKHLFQTPESPFREYFRTNDVFILDRGFRDSLGLLTDLGYQVHKPESLEAGQTQLSTYNANKSRCVTLCRWVVEVVNGRFKRDFKLLRNKYFNVCSKHLMNDFKIAAALLNNFHPLIADHQDAHIILDRALNRLEMPNVLAERVIAENMNRDRRNFVNVDAQLPQLHVFPVMEMRDLILFALGTYQVKQARSYYGEHIG